MGTKLLTLKEASNELGMSSNTLRRRIKAGSIAVQQGGKGGNIYITQAEIDRLKGDTGVKKPADSGTVQIPKSAWQTFKDFIEEGLD